MKDLITAFLDFGISGYITLFTVILSSIFSIFICYVLIRAMHKQDFSRLVINDNTGLLSQHKFWANIAFLVATIAFIKVNFLNGGDDGGGGAFLAEIWIIYLTVIGGVDVFNSFMKSRSGKRINMSVDESEYQNYTGDYYNPCGRNPYSYPPFYYEREQPLRKKEKPSYKEEGSGEDDDEIVYEINKP